MNVLYRMMAQVANALEALWRWATALEEVRPDPYYLSRYAAWTQASLEPAEPEDPEAVALAWTFRPGVSLRKSEPVPQLVRPFVGQMQGPARPATVDLAKRVVTARRAVGRAAVRAVDALGLPMTPLATESTPTVGIFEQTLEVWKRTGRSNAIQWA